MKCSLEETQSQPNITFLTTPELQYAVYYSSSIFLALSIENIIGDTLQDRLLAVASEIVFALTEVNKKEYFS